MHQSTEQHDKIKHRLRRIWIIHVVSDTSLLLVADADPLQHLCDDVPQQNSKTGLVKWSPDYH